MPPRKRLLIFVVAYNAETTLTWVLERIPAAIFETYQVGILVIDDASADRTFVIGRQYQEAHPAIPLTVLRNEFNQGYGGNQKIGYAYAIAEGFDYVALIHGDGQYAPEELPRLMQPFQENTADAVFGSRMMERFKALRGGMPLYKYAGNRILTSAQNRMLGSTLSEFHSGYRIYSLKALRAIPFELNSNDFHFDTEIIIQLLNSKQRISELPIPTYYGNEICRVNGMKYAKDVMIASLRNVLHRAGLLYQRKFDTTPESNTHYDLKLGYASSHTYALAAVPDGASVLDIGSGPGGLAQELVRKGCEVGVVDQHAPETADPKVKVHVQDLDQPLAFEVAPYRYILLLDVIEHLKSPERFMERLRAQFGHEKKTVVITTPNIAFVVQRVMLLLGQFNYGRSGILDKTHTRLLTFRTTRKLLQDAGFRIRRVRGVPAPFPKVLGTGFLGRFALACNVAAIFLWKTLFAYQIYIEAETTPDVQFLLADAKAMSQRRAEALRAPSASPQGTTEESLRRITASR